ncbi:MAG: glucuronate isomerase [Armatimonadota bacterium]
MPIADVHHLRQIVDRAVAETKVTDVHTHIYPPCFGNLLLWGIDDLITYHYLIAETFRWVELTYDDYWTLSKREQADLIWRALFLENSPIAESNRGVLTVLQALGLDVASRDLASYRRHFEKLKVGDYVSTVFELGGVKDVVMTNDPFDEAERKVWMESYQPDPRFHAALRIDQLILNWRASRPRLAAWGYEVGEELTAKTAAEVRRFVTDWAKRMEAVYMAASLPPDFAAEETPSPDLERGLGARIVRECILPVCEELNLPFATMIGVKKLINPDLRLAGDGVGKASIETVEQLCTGYPRNKFLVTMLSRENQHELAVAARKFRNLMPFGCWWFLNNPSLVDEITRMRLELLGLSFIPQHSDARVLDQLIYKWRHSRLVIADALCDKYADLMATGWRLDEAEVKRDVGKLFGGNFWAFLARKL